MKNNNSRLLSRTTFVLLLALSTALARAADAPAGEETPPTVIGSGPDQVHAFVMGALVDGDNSEDVYFGGEAVVEIQLHEFLGIRFSGFQDLVETNGDQLAYKFTSARFGPALHLRPYKRIDLGGYASGGVLIVDLVDGKTDVIEPEVTIGGFLTVYLDETVFVQAEIEKSWSNVEINQVISETDRTAAKLGFGVTF